ncbi:MAG TPA: PAS domain-containing protein, partial [Acidobacteriota bacterium]|nr:PAS domain-containing protein [Acidobacteriota bacterium]
METRFTPLTSTHALTILETLQAIDIGLGNSPRPVMVLRLTSLQPFDFRFLYTNRAVTELTGFEREVLEHHSLSAIFPPQLNQLQFEKLAHAINSHFQDTIDLICRALDGTEHFVKATISPWRNTTELPWYFTVECQETTEYPE